MPLPLSTPVRVVAPVPPDPTTNVADNPAAVPVVFWFKVGKVQLVRSPEVGVPNIGVTRVGEVANTKEPVPVSSVTALIKLALDGVAKNVATPVPSPLTPVPIGKSVQEVNVPELGVPNTGVVSVGDVRVLFVSVSVPAKDTKSASVTAVLNCAKVPLTVLDPKAIVLFVNV